MNRDWLVPKIFIFLIAVVYSFQAEAGLCNWILVKTRMRSTPEFIGRIRLARSSSEFSEAERAVFREKHQSTLQQLEKLPRLGAKVDSDLVAMAQLLADKANLSGLLSNPEPLSIISLKDRGDDDIPRTEIRAGVLSINSKMLKLLDSDDELAALIGHELLHQFLAHDLLAIKFSNRPLIRFLKKRASVDAFPIIQTSEVFGDFLASRVSGLKNAHEKEVDEALPVLMFLAGYNPWAIVSLNKRILYSTWDAPPILLDGYTRQKLIDRTDLLIKQLKQKFPEFQSRHGSAKIRAIKDNILPEKEPGT